MAQAALSRWWAPAMPSGQSPGTGASTMVISPAPAAMAASRSQGTATGSPARPMTTRWSGLKMPAFSAAMPASVGPRMSW